MASWFPRPPWEDPQMLYANAARRVKYVFGKPIPFNAKLAARMDSDDPADRKKAWEEAEALYG